MAEDDKSVKMSDGMHSGLKKQLWKVVFAKSTIYQARLTCEFIINSSGLDRAPYNMMVAGFTISYARLFDSGNEGVGCLAAGFGKFQDPQLQNTHEALLHARNIFTAHLNAAYKYADHDGADKEEILKLYIRIGPAASGGLSDGRAFLVAPEVPRDNIPRYKALCDDLLPRLDSKEKELIVKLYERAGVLKIGDNPISIFDEN